MQLLEQLASGYSEVTESDIFTECASIMGYLECMGDLVSDDIVSESVILESLGTSITTSAKIIFDRIVDFLKKISKFISKHIQLYTPSSKKSKDQPEELTEVEIWSIFKKNLYTGPTCQDLSREVVLFCRIFNENVEELTECLSKIIKGIGSYKNDGNDSFGKYVALGWTGNGWNTYKQIKEKQRKATGLYGVPIIAEKFFSTEEEFLSTLSLRDNDGDAMETYWNNCKKKIDELTKQVEINKKRIEDISNSNEWSSKAIKEFTGTIEGWARVVTFLGTSVTTTYTKYTEHINTINQYYQKVSKILDDARTAKNAK